MSASAQSPISPQFNALIVSALEGTFYIMLAALVIWLWDILLNLDVEISVMWSRKGAIAKTFYALIRYCPLFVVLPNVLIYNPIRTHPPSDNLCHHLYFIILLTQGIGNMVVTTVFALRVYTLYVNSKAIRKLLVVAIAALHLVLLGTTLATAITVSREMISVPPFNICFDPGVPLKTFSLWYGSTLVAETIIVAVTLYHAVQFHRASFSLKGTAPGIVIATLHRDGFSYFAFIFSTRLVLCILMWGVSSLIVPILTSLEFALMSTLTSRWLLSFRQLAISVWGDSQTIQAECTTSHSITRPPTSTIDAVTHSLGFSAWEPTGVEHPLQELSDLYTIR